MQLSARIPRAAAAALLALALALTACGGDPLEEGADGGSSGEDDGGSGGEDAGAVTVGSANFPESVLLANLYALAIEDLGVDVSMETNIGSREVYYPALQDGEIDLLPEYVGSLLNFVAEDPVEETGTEELLEQLRGEVGEGVEVLEPSEAQNRNALVVRPETAEELDLETTSDLVPHGPDLVAGGAPETRERADGLPGYERVYDLEFGEWRDLDAGGPLTIEALENGDVDVARLFTSMPVIRQNDWVVLEDDGGLIPAENLVPVAREEALSDEMREQLNAVSDALTLDELVAMNERHEIDNDDPGVVAEEWLSEQGIVG